MASYSYCFTCKELTMHYRIGDELKCEVCVQTNKQKHINLVHMNRSWTKKNP